MTHNVKLAPDPVSRVRIVEFFADEMRHQKIFDGVVRSMGEVPDDDFVSSIDGLNATDSIGSWLDLALLNTFIDRVGGFQLFDYAESSFAPLARSGVKRSRLTRLSGVATRRPEASGRVGQIIFSHAKKTGNKTLLSLPLSDTEIA